MDLEAIFARVENRRRVKRDMEKYPNAVNGRWDGGWSRLFVVNGRRLLAKGLDDVVLGGIDLTDMRDAVREHGAHGGRIGGVYVYEVDVASDTVRLDNEEVPAFWAEIPLSLLNIG